jgi:hypothetical protein
LGGVLWLRSDVLAAWYERPGPAAEVLEVGEMAAPEPSPARSLVDLFADMDHVRTATAVRAYVSGLPSGLHQLAAPRRPAGDGQVLP